MAKKKTNPSIEPKPQQKIQKYQEYLSTFNFKRTPYNVDTLRVIAEDYIAWGKLPDSLILDKFPRSRGIPLGTWNEWIAKYDYIRAAHKEVKREVGGRREELAFLNKANATIFMTSAPHYDYDSEDLSWKQLLQLKAELTNKEDTRPTITVVEIPSFTKTPEEVAMAVRQKTRKITKLHYNDRKRDADERTSRNDGKVHADPVIKEVAEPEDED